jgi:hypothetical protein
VATVRSGARRCPRKDGGGGFGAIECCQPYADNCGACHGFSAMSTNVIADLRYLDANDTEKIRAFPIKRAHDLKDEIAAAQAATEDKTK